MAAGGGDLQRPLHILLAHHIPQVRQGNLVPAGGPDRGGRERLPSSQMGRQCLHIRHSVDGEAAGKRRLRRVFRRDEQLPDTRRPGCQGHGQNAVHPPQRPSEGKLPHEGRVRRQRRHLAAGSENPHKNRKIIKGASLFLARRCQVHRNAADREPGAAVFHRRPDTLPGLPHGGVRQAHHVKGRQAAGEKALCAHLVSRNSAKSQGPYCDHHPIAAFLWG